MRSRSVVLSTEYSSVSSEPGSEQSRLSPDLYFPHYQPLIYLPSGGIAGYELLARTRDNGGNIVSAGMLFSDPELPAEGKIAVDRHLRGNALSQFRSDEDAGFISINISPDWISRLGDKLASPTLKMIESSGVDPARVVIEITETHGELRQLQRLVQQYHSAGLRVAIDDFGAGNSQLDRIIALHPDMIKLDMRLFKMAARGGLSADVLLGMMALAERSGCEVVCEGVETVEEFFFGIECGAQYMQGFLFAPALPAPIAPNSFKAQVDDLIRQYFSRKCERVGASIDHSREIKVAVMALARELTAQFDNGRPAPEKVAHRRLHDLGVMRFFLCDSDGTQLSPNYEIGADGIAIDNRFVGHNWCWRPYFPTLTTMRHRAGFDLVASTAYRDANSGQLCKTFGLFLDDQRVLLVDAAVGDEVLHATTLKAVTGY
jgi:EAL domain-containing protein (putative c-di-GMP-specific phosphodiesterase class I)